MRDLECIRLAIKLVKCRVAPSWRSILFFVIRVVQGEYLLPYSYLTAYLLTFIIIFLFVLVSHLLSLRFVLVLFLTLVV